MWYAVDDEYRLRGSYDEDDLCKALGEKFTHTMRVRRKADEEYARQQRYEQYLNMREEFDPEFRAKQAEAMKKRHSDPEFRAKNAEAMKRRHADPEYKAKLIDSAKKALSKPIICIETGAIYPSLSQCERETGISHQNISKAISGKQKTAGGYHWRFATADEAPK